MKKIFLDQFFIKRVTFETSGFYRLDCYAIKKNGHFNFELKMHFSEFKALYFRIKKYCKNLFSNQSFQDLKNSLKVDFCWIKLREEVIGAEEDTDFTYNSFYMVEQFGFLPDYE
jgi:hypothetical protein